MLQPDPKQPIKNIRKKWLRVFGILLATIPFIWIILRIDFQRLKSVVPLIAWWTIPLLTAAILLAITLQGLRWWILLRVRIPGLSFRRTMSYHLIGTFYSIVLPSSASSDIVKTVLISQKMDYSSSWGATWICRIMALLALALFSIFGLYTIGGAMLSRWQIAAITTALLLSLIILSLSFSKRFTAPLRPVFQKFSWKKITTIAENIRQGIYEYREHPLALASSFLVTLMTQATVVLSGCFTLYGITGNLHLSEYFAFVPVIEVAAGAGPTPNGIGSREALTVVFFNYLKVSNEQLGIYVFLTVVLGLGVKLVGGLPIVHALYKNHKKSSVCKEQQAVI